MNTRNVAILSVSQALAFCGGSMVILLGGLIGSAMAPNAALATLPMAMMVVGIALFAVPAALLMKRIGRKRGFILAMATGTLAALGAAYAVTAANYLLFCAAALFIGGNFAFAQQFRFAAAESADRQHAGRAVAFVLLGGVVAGILGPQVAKLASGWLPTTYAGSFLALAGLYAVAAVALLFFKNPPAQAQTKAEPERPLRAIVTQPGYLAALWAGLAAYGVMGFIMTSAPISLHVLDHHSVGATTLVIQSHIVAMYLPSLFTGLVIGRLGSVRMALMPGGTMALLIGDVSGKGLPAAILMANLQATIQARLPFELDLVKLAEQLNGEIVVNNAEAYLTLFLAILDPQSLKLRYINAGHNPQFLLHEDGSVEQMRSTGRPIGLLEGSDFEEKSILLKNGDSLFFYTDGLIEAVNAAGEEFGMQRLEAILVEERARGLERMLANIESTAKKYRGGIEAGDDATMMLLKIGAV